MSIIKIIPTYEITIQEKTFHMSKFDLIKLRNEINNIVDDGLTFKQDKPFDGYLPGQKIPLQQTPGFPYTFPQNPWLTPQD